jgi:hypothetical protein
MLTIPYRAAQNLFFSSHPLLRRAMLALLLMLGAFGAALYIGILGPMIAMAPQPRPCR